MSDLGPLQSAPRSVHPPFDQCDPSHPEPREVREAAIREALEGVELGAYDERIVTWLAGSDVATVGTAVSWLLRVRHAEE